MVEPLLVEKYREDFLGQLLERFAVAKEVGHADQHILEQQFGFLGGGPQVSQVAVQIGDGIDLQASLDTATHGGALVLVEVMPTARAQQGEDLVQGSAFVHALGRQHRCFGTGRLHRL
ncbi:hypothetical protein D3C76_832400 [compost metagenome]